MKIFSNIWCKTIKKIIQTEIADKIAYLILSNKIKEDCNLKITSNNENNLVFNYD